MFYSVLGFIMLLTTEHYHDIDVEMIYQIGTLLAAVIFIWVVILGVGLYRRDSELSPSTPGLACYKEHLSLVSAAFLGTG